MIIIDLMCAIAVGGGLEEYARHPAFEAVPRARRHKKRKSNTSFSPVREPIRQAGNTDIVIQLNTAYSSGHRLKEAVETPRPPALQDPRLLGCWSLLRPRR